MNLELLNSLIERPVRRNPDGAALIHGNEEISYRKLRHEILRAARYISSNTAPGDVVAVFSDNSPQFFYVFAAVCITGRICEAIETRISEVHLRDRVSFSNPRMMFVSEKYRSKVERLSLGIPLTSFDLPESESEIDLDGDLNLPCMIKYTSGTTGEPKPMHIPQRTLSYIPATLIDYFRITDEDRYYLLVPMQYLEGLGWVWAVLAAGGTVVIATDTFDYARALREIEHHKITLLSMVPLTLKILVRHYLHQLQQVQESIRVLCTSSAAMPVAVSRTLLDETTLDLYTDYGLNEAPRVSFFRFRDYPDRLTSIGHENKGVDVFLTNREGSLITHSGKHGEICVRGPQVIAGYLNNDDTAGRTVQDRVLHTGDYGYRDEEGLLYLVGRQDDVINIGGEKVALSEIDAAIELLDEVSEAGCLAVEDELRDFVIDAYVTLADGVTQSPDLSRKLKRHSKTYLESYKVPRSFTVIDAMPKTSLGKLQRGLLRRKVGTPS